MNRLLLFSDDEKQFLITDQILKEKCKLTWCTYHSLEKNEYPSADVVVMHFNREKTKSGAFDSIIRVKGKLGHSTPILAIIEGGSTQVIFSLLEIGVFDYIDTTDNIQKYQKKLEDILLWSWYIKQYGSTGKGNGR